ncbi:hypothetical protein Acr_18g0010630 [Actinidia rufa]|uniref:Uncharacterized protein n=1 Tax=Actinidia rufa TaxID=165716 RepID=A0A7J0G7X9_9ERIC|nr:hypothetical protein Acr_18g0010630 [Actinidia rufa]
MGFPIGYTELLLPKLLLFTLLALGSLRKLILSLFRSMGLGDFLEPEISWPTRPDCTSDQEARSGSSDLIRELLPVARFSDLVDPQEGCAGVPARVRRRRRGPVSGQLLPHLPSKLSRPVDRPRPPDLPALSNPVSYPTIRMRGFGTGRGFRISTASTR